MRFRLGRSYSFLSLYGFANWTKESYGLAGGEIKDYYVDSSYVKFSDRSAFPLRTTESINLNINRYSAGLMAEFYFYPTVFINLRAGYNAISTSDIEFEAEDEDDNPIDHLTSPYEFEDRRNKQVIDFGSGWEMVWRGTSRILSQQGKKMAC